jgi:hypothetical protein
MPLPFETILVFLYGWVLLGLWALAANENRAPMRNLIKLSALYFLTPILLVVALIHSVLPALLIVSPFVPLGEEWLKRMAGRRVLSENISVFYLICLFGIWELTISKSLMPLFSTWPSLSSDWSIAVFIWLVSLPIIMHASTAAIYAFYRRGDGNLRYWPCVAIHWAFNASRELYGEVPFDEVSLLSLVIDSAVWVLLLLFLLRRAIQSRLS